MTRTLARRAAYNLVDELISDWYTAREFEENWEKGTVGGLLQETINAMQRVINSTSEQGYELDCAMVTIMAYYEKRAATE